MSEINLISSRLAASETEMKIGRNLKSLTFVFTGVFIISLLVIISLYLVNQRSLAALIREKDDLVNEVKKMENVEQQYSLVVDRVSKIKEVQSKKSADEDWSIIESFISEFPTGVVLKEANIGEKNSEIIISVPSSSMLKGVFDGFSRQESFGSVKLNGFSYSGGTGYLLTFELTKV